MKNDGGGIAKECKAKLSFLKSTSEGIGPTQELKVLQWTRENTDELDIGAHDEEFLNIVFSMDQIDIGSYGRAYVSTSRSLNGPGRPRKEDAFSVGKHDIKIEIKSVSREKTEAVLSISVTSDWRELSMQKV